MAIIFSDFLVKVCECRSDEIVVLIMNGSKEDLIKAPNEKVAGVHLAVPHVCDPVSFSPRAVGEEDRRWHRRHSRAARRSAERVRGDKQKFFTVYDGLSKWMCSG